MPLVDGRHSPPHLLRRCHGHEAAPVRFLEETDGNGKQCEAVSPAAAIDDAEASAESWTICGSLCTTNDILVKSLPCAICIRPRARLRACWRLLHDRGRVAAAVP